MLVSRGEEAPLESQGDLFPNRPRKDRGFFSGQGGYEEETTGSIPCCRSMPSGFFVGHREEQ